MTVQRQTRDDICGEPARKKWGRRVFGQRVPYPAEETQKTFGIVALGVKVEQAFNEEGQARNMAGAQADVTVFAQSGDTFDVTVTSQEAPR